MPRRCVYYNCSSSNRSLFWWPRDTVIARKWTAFVSRKRAQWKPSSTSVLCGRHFTNDSFTNYSMFTSGFATKLHLKPDAIPTIHINDDDDNSQSDTTKRPTYAKRKRKELVETLVADTVSNEELQPSTSTAETSYSPTADTSTSPTSSPDRPPKFVEKSSQKDIEAETKGNQTLAWRPKCNRRHYPSQGKLTRKKTTGTQMTPKMFKPSYDSTDTDVSSDDEYFDDDSDYDPGEDPNGSSSTEFDDE
ncbi:uncharacterized protein LOC141911560 [Tubulanus polymorphus]|uniref:uncharacterized protein LOC141911560 n=1 Tax=Tubulanus polymorphus TaxID=672921 RepID=UPI003DA36E3A